MAEEKKNKETTDKAESYKLSAKVCQHGYNATIDGRKFVIGFATDFQGRRASKYASVCSLQDSPDGMIYIPVQPPQYSLSNLTDLQLYELNVAGVLELTDEQSKAFREKFFKPSKK